MIFRVACDLQSDQTCFPFSLLMKQSQQEQTFTNELEDSDEEDSFCYFVCIVCYPEKLPFLLGINRARVSPVEIVMKIEEI